jgi:hypothetical protein
MNSNKSTIRFAGEYVLDEFSIIKPDSDLALDVRNQLQSLYIYEDMFAPFITGTAVIRDTIDIPNLFGRGGKNLIKIKISTPGISEFEGFFHLYKISDRSEVAERVQVFTLNFVSIESLIDTSLHISKKFTGSPTEIAKTIFEQYYSTSKKINTSNSTNRIAYISNYWSAVTNIAYLCDNALSARNTADFVSFENRDGFNFISVEDIINQPEIQSFTKTDYTMTPVRKNDTSVVRDINLEYQQIQEINVDTLYDSVTDNDSGVFKTRVLIHDITRKQYQVDDYSQLSDNKSLLNKNRLYQDSVIETARPKIISSRKQFGLFERVDLSNAGFISKRVMHIAMLQGQKLQIDVMGRIDYTVGKKVNINLNQLKNITKDMGLDEITDKMLSGFFIITAILHKFDGKAHTSKLELMKDSTISS